MDSGNKSKYSNLQVSKIKINLKYVEVNGIYVNMYRGIHRKRMASNNDIMHKNECKEAFRYHAYCRSLSIRGII